MIGDEPKFMRSPYFVDEPGNWHLKPGAPKKIQKEFEEYMAPRGILSIGDEPVAKTFNDVVKARGNGK